MTRDLTVLESANYIAGQAKYVSVDTDACEKVAVEIYNQMKEITIKSQQSIKSKLNINDNKNDGDVNNSDNIKKVNYLYLNEWSNNELNYSYDSNSKNDDEHNEFLVNWIFLIDLLNFSFWSDYDLADDGIGNLKFERFTIKLNEKLYTGYWSLIAIIKRAIEIDKIDITNPYFWIEKNKNNDDRLDFELFKYIFRSETKENIPMLKERFDILKEVGYIMKNKLKTNKFSDLIKLSNYSAVNLIKILIENFPNFRDEGVYNGIKGMFIQFSN